MTNTPVTTVSLSNGDDLYVLDSLDAIKDAYKEYRPSRGSSLVVERGLAKAGYFLDKDAIIKFFGEAPEQGWRAIEILKNGFLKATFKPYFDDSDGEVDVANIVLFNALPAFAMLPLCEMREIESNAEKRGLGRFVKEAENRAEFCIEVDFKDLRAAFDGFSGHFFNLLDGISFDEVDDTDLNFFSTKVKTLYPDLFKSESDEQICQANKVDFLEVAAWCESLQYGLIADFSSQLRSKLIVDFAARK